MRLKNQDDKTGAEKKKRKRRAPRPMERLTGRHLSLEQELMLASLPTVIVLIVFALVGLLAQQEILFTSLASSAFLIYINPAHPMNNTRTVIIAQMIGAIAGFSAYAIFSLNYLAVGAAMIFTIVLMIVLNVAHPPAVSTALLFGLSGKRPIDLALFAFALLLTVTLIVLQRSWLGWMSRFVDEREKKKKEKPKSW